MKKYFSIAVLCALAVLGLGSCAKDVEEEIVTEQTGVRTVTFSASLADQTKTGLSMKFVPNWINTSLENVHLFETSGSTILEGVDVEMRIPADRNNEVAYFKADFAEEISIIVNPPSGQTGVKTRAGEEYTYTGIVAQKADGKFTIPPTQTPDPVSLIDPNADFLIGDTKTNFSESMAQKEMDIYFHRPVSVSRLAIMNIAGEKVKTVKITSNDKLTASAAYSDVTFSTGEVNWDNSGSNVLTISYGEGKEIPGENTFYAYFISLPGNKSITSIEVTTDQYVYTKSYASGKTLKFDTVEFRNIAVDMSKVTPTPVGPVTPVDQDIYFFKDNERKTQDSYDFYLDTTPYVTPELRGAAEGATVTFSIECTPAGAATISPAGVVTPVAVGNAVITATASAVTGYKESYASYTLAISDSTPDAVDQDLSFVKDGVAIEDDTFYLYPAGGTYTAPTLTGAAEGATVTYAIECTPEGVATIDASTGAVTPVADGTAVITATASAVAPLYKQTSTSYTLHVIDNTPAPTTVTVNLERATELVAGEKYILVSNGKALVRNGDEAVAADFDATAVSVAVPVDLRENLEWTLEKKTGDITRGNAYVFTEGEYFFGIAMNTEPRTYTYTVEVNAGRTLTEYISIQDHNISLAEDLIYYAGNSSNYYIFYNTTTNAWDNEKLANTATPAATSKTALYKVRDERTAQTLTFSADEAEYDLGTSTWTTAVPTLSGAQTSPLSWSSSDEDVATVDASGTVTAVAKGTATISVTAPADETYKSGSASFTVSVVNSNVPTYYKADAIVAGESYLIVSGSHALRNNNGSIAASEVVVNNGVIKYDAAATELWTATADDPGFRLTNNNQYLRRQSSNLVINSSASSTPAYNRWTYDAENEYLVVNDRYLYYNNSTFALNTSAQNAALYTTTPPKTPQSLQFSAPTLSGVVGQSVTPPTLTGAVTTPVYSSSAPAVVAVDASTGALTLLSAGTATITATAPAGTVSGVNYAEGYASYDVTVTAAPGEEKYYVLVTSEPASWDGKYLIVNTASDGTGTALNGTGTASVTISGGKILSTNTVDGYALTVTSAGEVHPNQTSSSQGLIAYDITFSDGEWLYWYSSKYKQTSETQSSRHNKCTLFYDNGGVRLMSAGYNVNLDGQSISTPSKNYLRYSGGGYSMGSSYANERVQLYRLNGGGTTPDPGPGPEPPTPTTSTYTRISGSDALVTGTYLIAEKTDAYLYNASNVQNATHGGYSTITSTTGITREGTTITLTEDLVASHEFVFTVTGDNLTITPAGGENAGKYMYATNNVSNTYIDFQTSENSFTIDPQEGNLVYFYTLKGSDHEYLYKKSSDSFFKLGGSGAPSSANTSAGIYLYKKN